MNADLIYRYKQIGFPCMNFANSDDFLIPYSVSCVTEAQKLYRVSHSLPNSALNY